jgi:hypothetical protein
MLMLVMVHISTSRDNILFILQGQSQTASQSEPRALVSREDNCCVVGSSPGEQQEADVD